MYRIDQRVSVSASLLVCMITCLLMMMKLKVCWKESGCTFSASITAVNGDGTFDVVRSLYNLNSDKFSCDEWQSASGL